MIAHADTASLFQIGTHVRAPVVPLLDGLVMHRNGAPETLAVVTTRAGFDALEDDWNRLFARSGHGDQMFQGFNWLWHWANHFVEDSTSSLAIVTIRRGGHLVGVLPLQVESAAGLKQLVFMGAPVSQYGDVLMEDMPGQERALTRALDFAIAATGADLVRFAKVRDNAVLKPLLTRRSAIMTGAEEAPYADLAHAGSRENYNARFSAKLLKNRRRLERRLAERGAVGLDWALAGRVAADAANATMVLKRAWLRTRGQLSRAFADPRCDRFFADVCAGVTHPAGAQASLLTSGGEIANAAITVEAKGRLAVHVLAYGLKFEKCAPGMLHVDKIIEQAFATGMKTVDFLAPRHEYKLEWSDGAVRVADYAIPVTVAGQIYARAYLGFVREKVKAAIKSTPRALAAPLMLLQGAMKMLRAQ